MKAQFGAAALLAMAAFTPPLAHAQDDSIARLRTNYSVLGFERPLRTGEDGCRARPDQRTCLLGNGAVVWLEHPAERQTIAYVVTAHHVLRALCQASAQNAAISAFGGPSPMASARVQIVAASCQDVAQRDEPDIAVVQIDISQLHYPTAAEADGPAPPPRPIRTVSIGPTLRGGAMYRAFGFDRDHRAIDYAPKAAEVLEDGPPWEFYIRVASNPGLSGSPVLLERDGDLAIVGVIARDPPLERCQFPPDSGEVSDLQTSRCEMRQNKVNWLISIGVELQDYRAIFASLPLERVNIAEGRRRIDAIRRYYENITRSGQNPDVTLASLRTAFEETPAESSLAPNIASWGAYFRSLTPLQVTRLLAYWDERFSDCRVPESVAFSFSQIASRIHDESQIEQLVQETNQACPQARVRALQNSAALIESLDSSERVNTSVTAFADNLGERFNLTREELFDAAGDRRLNVVLADRMHAME